MCKKSLYTVFNLRQNAEFHVFHFIYHFMNRVFNITRNILSGPPNVLIINGILFRKL